MRRAAYARQATKKLKVDSVEYFARYEKTGMESGMFAAMAACESCLIPPTSISYQRCCNGLNLGWRTLTLTETALATANDLIELANRYEGDLRTDFKEYVRDEMIRNSVYSNNFTLADAIEKAKKWADARAT